MRTLRYLSLGAGVQSSTCALMCEHGEIEPPLVAIFADTGWEPREVYAHLEWLAGAVSFPIVVVSAGNLRKDIGSDKRGMVRMPLYTEGDDGSVGRLRRSCTDKYKLVPIGREVRRRLGLAHGQRAPKGTMVTAIIGISADEAHRAKTAPQAWITKEYPLLDRRMQRGHCIQWLKTHGYPTPPRSACCGCPFHNDVEWRHLKAEQPEAFADAVVVDRMIRDSSAAGIEHPAYLHDSLMPLDEIDFRSAEDLGQLNMTFGNECEGMCGV